MRGRAQGRKTRRMSLELRTAARRSSAGHFDDLVRAIGHVDTFAPASLLFAAMIRGDSHTRGNGRLRHARSQLSRAQEGIFLLPDDEPEMERGATLLCREEWAARKCALRALATLFTLCRP